jgi:hypothetical protein
VVFFLYFSSLPNEKMAVWVGCLLAGALSVSTFGRLLLISVLGSVCFWHHDPFDLGFLCFVSGFQPSVFHLFDGWEI